VAAAEYEEDEAETASSDESDETGSVEQLKEKKKIALAK
jgi:hypothetical protein